MVEVKGKWYYMDTYFNAYFNTMDYFISETLWKDYFLDEVGRNISYFYTDGIPYLDGLNQKEYKYYDNEVDWDDI